MPSRKKAPAPSPYVLSLRAARLKASWGQYFDAVMDKLFIVPVWVFALSQTQSYLAIMILWSLILLESASGFVRTLAYYSGPNSQAAAKTGAVNSCSRVKSDEVGKAKQTFEMVGTALFVLDFGPTRMLGLLILFIAVPLSTESIRRKIEFRILHLNLITL